MNVRTLVPLLAAVTLVSVACDRKPDNSQHVDRIRAVTASTPSWVRSDALAKRLWRIERAFYQQRAFTPAWVDGDRTTAQWKDLVQQLKYSERHGLDPAKYHVAEFEQFREQSQTKTSGTRFPLDQVPELDAKMTFAYLRYAADLLGWDENPKAIYEDWIVPSRKVDLAGQLTDAVSKGSVRESLESLAPTHQQYKGLQAALAFERQHPSGHADQIRMNMERWRWAPHDLGDRYVLRMRFWLPRAALTKYPDRPYREWERAGLLTVTEGDTTDDDLIEETILEDARRDGIREIAYDKRFAHQLALHLQGAGLTVLDTPQGYALNESIRSVQKLIVEGAILHGDNLVMTWQMDNAVLRPGRFKQVRLDKEVAKDKIDGPSALVMANARRIAQPVVQPPSYQMVVFG